MTQAERDAYTDKVFEVLDVKTEKSDTLYMTVSEKLPGASPVGWGKTKAEAQRNFLAHLFYMCSRYDYALAAQLIRKDALTPDVRAQSNLETDRRVTAHMHECYPSLRRFA